MKEGVLRVPSHTRRMGNQQVCPRHPPTARLALSFNSRIIRNRGQVNAKAMAHVPTTYSHRSRIPRRPRFDDRRAFAEQRETPPHGRGEKVVSGTQLEFIRGKDAKVQKAQMAARRPRIDGNALPCGVSLKTRYERDYAKDHSIPVVR